MSTQKHTSGPWQVWPTHWAGGSDAAKFDGVNTIWIDSPRGELARLKPNGRKVDELVYADAHLIAAAPELLEACKAALNGLYSYRDIDGNCSARTEKEQLIAAIDKAEGRL